MMTTHSIWGNAKITLLGKSFLNLVLQLRSTLTLNLVGFSSSDKDYDLIKLVSEISSVEAMPPESGG